MKKETLEERKKRLAYLKEWRLNKKKFDPNYLKRNYEKQNEY